MWLPFSGSHARWEIDIKNSKLIKTSLDNITGEFPRFDERFALRKYTHGYYAGSIGNHPKGMSLNSIIHYDYNTGERKSYTTAEGGAVGEPVFAPKSKDSKDGEGWLIATEYNGAENRSNLIFLDAQHVDDGPVATAQQHSGGSVQIEVEAHFQKACRHHNEDGQHSHSRVPILPSIIELETACLKSQVDP